MSRVKKAPKTKLPVHGPQQIKHLIKHDGVCRADPGKANKPAYTFSQIPPNLRDFKAKTIFTLFGCK